MIILDERLKYLHKDFFDWKIFVIVTLITIIIGIIIALIIVAQEDNLNMREKNINIFYDDASYRTPWGRSRRGFSY